MGWTIPRFTHTGLLSFIGHALNGHCSKRLLLTCLGDLYPFTPLQLLSTVLIIT